MSEKIRTTKEERVLRIQRELLKLKRDYPEAVIHVSTDEGKGKFQLGHVLVDVTCDYDLSVDLGFEID